MIQPPELFRLQSFKSNLQKDPTFEDILHYPLASMEKILVSSPSDRRTMRRNEEDARFVTLRKHEEVTRVSCAKHTKGC